MFPQTVESHVFLACWQDMLREHNRELKYTAEMAGIQFAMNRNLESLAFTLFGYNQSYEKFYANVFRDVKNFEPSREFFETSKQRSLRNLRNWGLAEPSQRLGTHEQELMYTDFPTITEMRTTFEALTYDKFLALKCHWLSNLHITWLIQGHLVEDDALNMVRVAESALDYQPLAKDYMNYLRLVKLNDRTVYSFEHTNENPDQPNSACEAIWHHTFETDIDNYAVAKVLKSFLEEPTFNTLRTQEQLGYIVRASLGSQFRMLNFSILVQSSVQGADFVEHRINEFLANLRETWNPTDEEVETIKAA